MYIYIIKYWIFKEFPWTLERNKNNKINQRKDVLSTQILLQGGPSKMPSSLSVSGELTSGALWCLDTQSSHIKKWNAHKELPASWQMLYVSTGPLTELHLTWYILHTHIHTVYMSVYVCRLPCACLVPLEVHKGIRFPGPGVKKGISFHVGAENWAWVRAASELNPCTISADLVQFHKQLPYLLLRD